MSSSGNDMSVYMVAAHHVHQGSCATPRQGAAQTGHPQPMRHGDVVAVYATLHKTHVEHEGRLVKEDSNLQGPSSDSMLVFRHLLFNCWQQFCVGTRAGRRKKCLKLNHERSRRLTKGLRQDE